MKAGKRFGILLLAAVFLMACAQMLFAYEVQFTGENGYGIFQSWATLPSGANPTGTYGGGEFTVKQIGFDVLSNYAASAKNQPASEIGGSTTEGTFQTFCLEMNEYVSAGQKYNAVFNIAAVNGGTGGGTPDTLSVGTAWLYSQFAKGTLQPYSYGGNEADREASAAALQIAIWYLEGEITGTISNDYLTLVAGQFDNSLDYAKADYNPAHWGVRVLNLTDSNGSHQDMLVATPIPPAVWLLGAGVVGLVGLRRRMKN